MRRRRYFGSIRRLPSGRYQARYKDKLTGKRWIPAPETFATRADADVWLAKLQAGALDTAQLQRLASDLRLEAYASEWIETRPLRPRTKQLYELQLRLHIAPTLGEARVARLEPSHIRRWHSELLAGHLGSVSVAKVYRLLRSILNTAVEDGLIDRNPCLIKGAGLEKSAERPIPTLADLERVSQALPDRFAAVPWVAGLAGLRKGELFGLARRHINLRAGTIQVERALQEISGEGVVLVEPKTLNSARTVAMPKKLRRVLSDHMDTYTFEGADALVFTNAHGRPVRATVWSKAWNGARIEAGLPGLRLHDLRHLAGTLTAQAGATLRETMDRMGHSTTDAAMRYQHVADERRELLAQAIDSLIEDK